jgi:putative PIN family toxin of toxin-antitoxin system
MRIVCDTNILVSAILYGGRPRDVLKTLSAGQVRGFMSPALETELRGVLRRPKFGVSESQLNFICETLAELFERVYPTQVPLAIDEDPADNAVLACALEADADSIVSGDSHLLALGRFQGIRIVRPADFLGRLGTASPPP